MLLRQGYGLVAKLYALGATILALALLGASLLTSWPVIDRDILITAAVLGVISLLLEFIDFPLLIGGATSFSTVAYIAMVFMLPFPLPAIVGAAVVLAADLRTRRPMFAMVFNAANFVLTFGVSSLIWHLTYGSKSIAELPHSPVALLVVLLIIIVFYSINVFLMNGLIAIVGQRSIKYIWLTNDFDMFLPYICLEVIGTLVALIWTSTPILTPLLIIPAITSYIAFEMIHRLQHQTQEAMIAMADAIDQRDPYTADHSRRVAELAVKIAEVHGVNERDIERLRIAARMHDIGKIGIGNDLLHKPGKLTDDEWEILRAHPVIGEQLLKPYRQFRHETRLVRHHHERWDGKGYPDRVRGQAIPLGARIIAVADTFDAMTTSRPYRPALSRQYAIDEIRNGALSQFDPQIVASFLQVMEESSKIRSITGEDLPPSVKELEHAPAWYSSLP
ncbi:MAG TPA: HD-GYP domain-containing protein [Thermomicrobiales bacterium]|nr:HD-GYP domain-containing protein [Thermomicrobiales bacterium]